MICRSSKLTDFAWNLVMKIAVYDPGQTDNCATKKERIPAHNDDIHTNGIANRRMASTVLMEDALK